MPSNVRSSNISRSISVSWSTAARTRLASSSRAIACLDPPQQPPGLLGVWFDLDHPTLLSGYLQEWSVRDWNGCATAIVAELLVRVAERHAGPPQTSDERRSLSPPKAGLSPMLATL